MRLIYNSIIMTAETSQGLAPIYFRMSQIETLIKPGHTPIRAWQLSEVSRDPSPELIQHRLSEAAVNSLVEFYERLNRGETDLPTKDPLLAAALLAGHISMSGSTSFNLDAYTQQKPEHRLPWIKPGELYGLVDRCNPDELAYAFVAVGRGKQAITAREGISVPSELGEPVVTITQNLLNSFGHKGEGGLTVPAELVHLTPKDIRA